MQKNIKTSITVTPDVQGHIERLFETLEKLVGADSGALVCDIELEKTTEHHQAGKVFRAEVNLSGAGEYVRAEAEAETILAALDEVRDEMRRLLSHRKHKRQSIVRRTGARLKELLRFSRFGKK